ncbi:MAG: DUF4013 domain-containing protein [Methanomicrobiaceae archaeon]|nr:DUF4013 domain-containing protein [Methanomicrobiaceae archaeon]
MDIVHLLVESYIYTQKALWGRWRRWFLLLIGSIIFPIIYGYAVRILQGADPAPEPKDLGRLVVDGIRLWLVYLIYAVPVIVIIALSVEWGWSLLSRELHAGTAVWLTAFTFGFLLAFFIALLLALYANIGAIRFARTGRFGAAFHFGGIGSDIRRIGWTSYAFAIILLYAALLLICWVLIISVIGVILLILLAPAFMIFHMRFIERVYESAGY